MTYENYSVSELRDMLLRDELRSELMTEELYRLILINEADFDNPVEKVIDFCISGLNQYENYNRNIPRTSIDDLFAEYERRIRKEKTALNISVAEKLYMVISANDAHYDESNADSYNQYENYNIDTSIRPIDELFAQQEQRNRKKRVTFNIFKKLELVAAIVITVTLTQFISMSLGYNIFDWRSKDPTGIIDSVITTAERTTNPVAVTTEKVTGSGVVTTEMTSNTDVVPNTETATSSESIPGSNEMSTEETPDSSGSINIHRRTTTSAQTTNVTGTVTAAQTTTVTATTVTATTTVPKTTSVTTQKTATTVKTTTIARTTGVTTQKTITVSQESTTQMTVTVGTQTSVNLTTTTLMQPNLTITSPPTMQTTPSTTSPSSTIDNNTIYYFYDISYEWRSLISPYITGNYKFDYAYCYSDTLIAIFHNGRDFIHLFISNSSRIYFEINDKNLEVTSVNDIYFNSFTNAQNLNQAVWDYNNYYYTFTTNQSLDTVRTIINNYY